MIMQTEEKKVILSSNIIKTCSEIDMNNNNKLQAI